MVALSALVSTVLVCILMMKIKIIESSGHHCPVSLDIQEFKKYHESVKEVLHKKDVITDVSLLKAKVLNQIHPSEQCCFLLKLGRFYMNNIFPKLEISSIKEQKGLNHLANSVLGLKIELKHCHSSMRCPCGDQSHKIMEDFRETFYQMETEAAIIKAIGDLNILIRWLEKNYQG
ncbi:interleukin-20 [Xenopus laevis]|uniref:Interleukin family protein n=3 Tax=Xenopus laevis TaxID=8355 RepID=A0A974DHQ6_XENLA|nr:interleukin-20 [Xenopus laevis]OCT91927.1 hypothetical protein XELAEV_18014984mg [Xenopus laevis]